jgi:mevalonate kinase
MVLGEHAVLHGKMSLVCAVNRRIKLTLIPGTGKDIRIQSGMGEYLCTTDRVEIHDPFQFVLGGIRNFLNEIKNGFDLVIESEFSENVGLGSSAAVTAATVAVLLCWLKKSIEPQVVFDESLPIIHEIQGKGSGADIAASAFGGLIAYRSQPGEISKLDVDYPISVGYSGDKTPTSEVIDQVNATHDQHPELYDFIYELMDKSSIAAIKAIKHGDWPAVGQILNMNQGLMEAIGVNNGKLSSLVYAMRKEPGVLGAKISGSGLGDCVIGLGEISNPNFPYPLIPLQMEKEGIRIESP